MGFISQKEPYKLRGSVLAARLISKKILKDICIGMDPYTKLVVTLYTDGSLENEIKYFSNQY